MRIYVIGIGNPWASDDGVGPEVIRRLQAEHMADDRRRRGVGCYPHTVALVTLPQAGVELIGFMDQCDVLILVDAVSSGAPPGTVHRQVWRPSLLSPRGMERASSHGVGVREVLSLAASLGRLPDHVVLWGIEAATTEAGEGLSPAVAASLPVIVGELCRELMVSQGGIKIQCPS